MIEKARYNEDDDEWIIPFLKKKELPTTGQSSGGQSFLPDINSVSGNGNQYYFGSQQTSISVPNSGRVNSRGGSRGGFSSTMLLTINGSSVHSHHNSNNVQHRDLPGQEEEEHFGLKTINMSRMLAQSQLPPTLDLQGIANKEPAIKAKKSARKDKKPKLQAPVQHTTETKVRLILYNFSLRTLFLLLSL